MLTLSYRFAIKNAEDSGTKMEIARRHHTSRRREIQEGPGTNCLGPDPSLNGCTKIDIRPREEYLRYFARVKLL